MFRITRFGIILIQEVFSCHLFLELSRLILLLQISEIAQGCPECLRRMCPTKRNTVSELFSQWENQLWVTCPGKDDFLGRLERSRNSLGNYMCDGQQWGSDSKRKEKQDNQSTSYTTKWADGDCLKH